MDDPNPYTMRTCPKCGSHNYLRDVPYLITYRHQDGRVTRHAELLSGMAPGVIFVCSDCDYYLNSWGGGGLDEGPQE